jgi:hypothetical protein
MTPITQVLAAVALSAVIVAALWQARQGSGSVGSFVAFVTGMLMLIGPMKHLSEIAGPITRGLAALERALRWWARMRDYYFAPNNWLVPFSNFYADGAGCMGMLVNDSATLDALVTRMQTASWPQGSFDWASVATEMAPREFGLATLRTLDVMVQAGRGATSIPGISGGATRTIRQLVDDWTERVLTVSGNIVTESGRSFYREAELLTGTGTEAFDIESVSSEARLSCSHTLSERFSLGYNFGLTWDGISAGYSGFYSLALGASLGEPFGP